jgi:hypothetical protein
MICCYKTKRRKDLLSGHIKKVEGYVIKNGDGASLSATGDWEDDVPEGNRHVHSLEDVEAMVDAALRNGNRVHMQWAINLGPTTTLIIGPIVPASGGQRRLPLAGS